jgi:hypothetical protein
MGLFSRKLETQTLFRFHGGLIACGPNSVPRSAWTAPTVRTWTPCTTRVHATGLGRLGRSPGCLHEDVIVGERAGSFVRADNL